MPKSILRRLKIEHTPLLNGNIATFVWKGESAPNLVGDFTGWDAGEPIILEKSRPGVWTCQVSLPLDAYIEYAFKHEEESLPDSFNPRRTSNGMGGYNHYFQMPEYKSMPLAGRRSAVSHGSITKHVISTDNFIFGSKRTIYLYQPPVSEPVPLMVIWDGQDYFHRAHLNLIVDSLIAQKRIQPLALAFVHNGTSATRAIEYACSDSTLVFLMTEVLPQAARHLNLIDIKKFPGTYGVIGASMGGLMALYTGIRIPQVFGNVLSQSGAFSLAGFDMVVFELLAHGEQRPLKIWMDVGVYDIPGLLNANQRMKNLLDMRGYKAEYREYHAGHNYPAWRNDIIIGLEYLYGTSDRGEFDGHEN